MKVGLSKRKHLPALFLKNSKVAFPLWAYGFVRSFEKSNFNLTPYAENVLSELCFGFYRPPFSLKGKTVLDLGACCGESAWYFLSVLGASKVVCVECDKNNVDMLERNRKASGLNFDVIDSRFVLDHLELPFDFLKCDIEGSEFLLLAYIREHGFSKPCVVEVHNENLRAGFEYVGFKVRREFLGDNFVCYLMNNYDSTLF